MEIKAKGTLYLKGKIKEVTGSIKQIGLIEKFIFDRKIGKIKSIDVLKLRSLELC